MELAIDIVSDVVCPWCFIGQRRLEAALATWRDEIPGARIAIRWLPYFLNPDTPPEGEPYRPFLEKKFGGAAQVDMLLARVAEAGRSAGIAFAHDKIKLRANTLAAHRLIHRAQGRDRGDAVVERLFAAHFLEGRHVGDLDVLADIAAASGDDRTAALAYLRSDEDEAAVREQAQRLQTAGINGVPFFVFNRRLSLSGAQPPETMLEAIRRATA